MKMSKYLYGLVLAVLVALMGVLPALAGDEENFKQIEEKGIRMMWAVDGDSLQVKIVAPTTGWIGMGLDPKKKMQGANFIIGCVKDGEVVIDDQYGVGTKKHVKDVELGGTDDVRDAAGREADGSTELSFKIPLDSGDEFDTKLELGKEVTVVVAYGKDDDTTVKHRRMIMTKITP